MTPLLLLAAGLAAPPAADWKELLQQPYANAPVPDLGLRPLLVRPDGKAITTKADWEPARVELHKTWNALLGKAPDKPESLDVRVEKTEKLDGYTRQLLSFAAEGDDRIAAYLLVPAGLKEGEKRPAVVVFHQTTR